MASPKTKIISRTVWILSMVSLFTDMASEMLYPIVPLYLESIGFTIIAIGVLEGVAEATAGLSKAWFGHYSDVSGKRVPFIRTGYVLSALSKPMLALFTQVWWVFTARTADRLGKGIRTGARDALLKEAATPATKARVFNFHRSMDTVGAFLGPSIALVFLHFYPGHYRLLFLLAFFPGLAAIGATFLLREKKEGSASKLAQPKASFFIFFSYLKNSNKDYKRLSFALITFALVNSSDVFLLLRSKELLHSDTGVIGLYIFYNITYALVAYPAGILADRVGIKKIFLAGVALFSLVYFGMAMAQNIFHLIIIFGLYGIYAATTEGISKAWITHLVPQNETATAVGTLSGLQNFSALIASSAAGLIWFYFQPSGTFLFTAFISMLVFFYILRYCTAPEGQTD